MKPDDKKDGGNNKFDNKTSEDKVESNDLIMEENKTSIIPAN